MAEAWHHEAEHGRWNANALRLWPGGDLAFEGIRGRSYVLRGGNRTLATLRRRGTEGWHCTIEGFEWRVTPDMGAARFGLRYVTVRLVKGAAEARALVMEVATARPALPAPEDAPSPGPG